MMDPPGGLQAIAAPGWSGTWQHIPWHYPWYPGRLALPGWKSQGMWLEGVGTLMSPQRGLAHLRVGL